jgi:hypothetical protein
MPQLDLTRIFLDNIIWTVGFILISIIFMLNFYTLPYLEVLWFSKFKINFKVAFKYLLLIKK